VKKLFVDVDTQCDFMDENGALYVPGAMEIRETLAKLTKLAKSDNKITLMKTMDRHDGSEPELKSNGGPFPPHCMAGTEGQAGIIETSANKANAFIKQCYDVFDDKLGNNYIAEWLEDEKFDEAWVYGVVGNICVEATVMGLLSFGIRVYVFENAVTWMDLEEGIFCKGPDNKEQSMKRMREAGVLFATAQL
jgi:nicotinamidase/pyrazinamidase